MTTLNISLPESLREFVDAQVAEGGYDSSSAFIEALIREAQKRQARERIDALLLEGLNSGEPIVVTPEYWEKKRRALEARLGKVSDT